MRQQPARGFDPAEFEARCEKAQYMMARAKLDLLFLTTEAHLRYFTGFLTQFWQSPTRPWFLLLPQKGKPVAIIPEIGRAGMAHCWVDEIFCWPAPQPADEGISLLCAQIKAQPGRYRRIGVPFGHESHLRMPQSDFQKLSAQLGNFEWVDCMPLLHRLQFIKSPAEIEKIHYVCQVASDGFDALPGKLSIGMQETDICRELKMDLLARGLDGSPYMISGSGAGGYDNIIMGPADKSIATGDILVIDTGSVFDGYFCDFDRNWAFGKADTAARKAYDCIWQATEAGFSAARPGMRMCDIFNAMWAVLEKGGARGNTIGRMGHGLGQQLTEGPSITPVDETILHQGAVITLEPGMEFAPGKQMVHEENIVITKDGARWLSNRAMAELPVIS